MASNTRKTKLVRKATKTKKGQRRKKALRSKGSTPKFAIHPKK